MTSRSPMLSNPCSSSSLGNERNGSVLVFSTLPFPLLSTSRATLPIRNSGLFR